MVPDMGLGATGPGSDWRYGAAFFKVAEEHKRPAIVLQSRAGDEAYLRARGIRELVALRDVKL